MLLKLFKCQVLGQGLFADGDDGAGAVLGGSMVHRIPGKIPVEIMLFQELLCSRMGLNY